MGLAFALEVPADLHDARNGLARLTEEFQADGARIFRHPVQNPARRGDQSVAAFLLHARQAAEEFVGDVLAQSDLAKLRAVDVESFAAQYLAPHPAARVPSFQTNSKLATAAS